jgi:hypothetical protein
VNDIIKDARKDTKSIVNISIMQNNGEKKNLRKLQLEPIRKEE